MRDLKDTVAIEKRCAESGEPVFVTKNGYGCLVVMDLDHYERTIRKMEEAKLLNEALINIENGVPLVDGEEVRQRMMKKYDIQL